ncbi:MAG: efflux RND transporter periplasmic adaptor subunit [Candidatus Sumerlaeia bacterium]|nr:efflux RND transporter periplasmic adaptor subunit [Candidatus Sumerlaeia bacterium]
MAALLGSSLVGSLESARPVEATPVVELAAKTPMEVDSPIGPDTARVQAAGWIEPDPYPIAVAALASGTVAEVLVREGDAVAAGDVVARLVDADARLALGRSEAELHAAEASWRLNTEGVRAVAVSRARTEETSAALALAEAERDSAAAALREAERTWRRYETLAESGSAAEADRNAAEAGRSIARADLDAATARIAVARAQHAAALAEKQAAEEGAEHRVAEARALAIARVEAEEARLRLERMELRAPVGGVVMRRLAAPGTRLMVDSDAMEAAHALLLYDPQRLQARVDVPLADAAKVGVGTPAEVTVELLPERKFPGTVTRIAGEADIQKNTLQVKVRLGESAPELRPEMLARVRFLDTPRGGSAPPSSRAVFVPAGAVAEGRAWVVSQFDGAEGIAAARLVSLTGAETTNGWLEVREGLRPGDLVVVAGAKDLAEGVRVKVTTKTGDP